MKTKTMLGIASLMVFGAALFMGLAVVVIFFLANQRNNEPEASLANNTNNSPSTSNEFAMLFDGFNGDAIRVNLNDGSSQNFDLGLTSNNIYLGGRVVSSDGRLIAYCAVERLSDVDVVNRFAIRDIEAGRNLIEQNFGNIPGCNPGAFSPDNSKVAVAFVFNSLITSEQNFPDEPNWALRIFDVNTGAVVQEFTADSPNAPDFEAMEEFWFEPGISPMMDVMDYSDAAITFLAYPFVGRDGPPAAPAFRWDLASNELSQIEGLGNNGGTYLPETGEIAYPHLNEEFPAAQPMGPVALANEVRLQDANGTRTIYRDTDNVIASLRFVNGGRQLAAMLIPAGDPDAMTDPAPVRYVLINRDGTVENMNSATPNLIQIFGTSNGFGVLRIESQQNAEQEFVNLHQILKYENGNLAVVWEYTPPPVVNGQIWMEYLWSTPEQIAPNLPPFAELN
jgi:hypothetical protein